MIPAIVLSTHNMGLGVIRSLGCQGIPVIAVYYEHNDMGYLSKYVTEAIPAPHPEQHEKEFLEILFSCRDRFGKCLIIPADDATFCVVSKNKELLEEIHLVACCDWEVAQRILNKKFTYAAAESIGVPIPKTLVPETAKNIAEFVDLVGFPCLVKPCYSHRYVELFRKKLAIVHDLDQALIEYERAQKAGIEVMIQEFIPGEDSNGANYNSLFSEGWPIAEITAQKIRLSPIDFGVPSVVLSKQIPEVVEQGRKLIKVLEASGYSCMEFKRDSRDGKYKLMEVNGRYNRSTLMANRCGINFPWIEYQNLVLGKKVTAKTWEEGVYWIDEFRDIYEHFVARKEKQVLTWEFLKPYASKKVFAAFDWTDLNPFFKRVLYALQLGKESSLKKFPVAKREVAPVVRTGRRRQ